MSRGCRPRIKIQQIHLLRPLSHILPFFHFTRRNFNWFVIVFVAIVIQPFLLFRINALEQLLRLDNRLFIFLLCRLRSVTAPLVAVFGVVNFGDALGAADRGRTTQTALSKTATFRALSWRQRDGDTLMPANISSKAAHSRLLLLLLQAFLCQLNGCSATDCSVNVQSCIPLNRITYLCETFRCLQRPRHRAERSATGSTVRSFRSAHPRRH